MNIRGDGSNRKRESTFVRALRSGLKTDLPQLESSPFLESIIRIRKAKELCTTHVLRQSYLGYQGAGSVCLNSKLCFVNAGEHCCTTRSVNANYRV